MPDYTKQQCDALQETINQKSGYYRAAEARRKAADSAFNEAEDAVARLKVDLAQAERDVYEANKGDDQEAKSKAEEKKGAATASLAIAESTRDGAVKVQNAAKSEEDALAARLGELLGEQRQHCS